MRVLSLLFIFLLALGGHLSAQSGPYDLRLDRELILGGAGALALGLGTYLQGRLDADRPLLADLSVNRYADVNAFDRLGTQNASTSARLLSDHVRDAGIGMGSLLFLHRDTRRDFGKLAVLYAETMALTTGLTNLIKVTAARPRPYTLADDWDDDRRLTSGDRASFLSGHTSTAAAGSFFFATVFSDYFPDSKLKRYVWGAAVTVPALTGYLRVRAAKHFPTDVLAGYALGAGLGYLVPTLHKRRILPRGMTISPTGTGLYAGLTF